MLPRIFCHLSMSWSSVNSDLIMVGECCVSFSHLADNNMSWYYVGLKEEVGLH